MTQIFHFTSFGWSIRMNPLMHSIQEWWFGHLRFPLQDCNYILHRDATSYASLRSMRMIFPKFPSRCWQQDHRDIVSTKMLHNVIRTWGYTHTKMLHNVIRTQGTQEGKQTILSYTVIKQKKLRRYSTFSYLYWPLQPKNILTRA